MDIATSEIDISLKSQIDGIRRAYLHSLSSHAFVNLYLWREEMGLRILAEDDFFAVSCAIFGKNAWFFPCGDEEKKKAFITRLLDEGELTLCYLRECDAEWLEANFPGSFEITRCESSDEYVCRVDDYLGLEGSTYSRLRRRIGKIRNEHSVRSVIVNEQNADTAAGLINEWGEYHDHDPSLVTDVSITLHSLIHREKLGLSGILLYVDGRPVSVVAGFSLDDDTVDTLIGKTLRDAPRDCMFLALWEYMNTCARGRKYCNVEEDLGIPGLKTFKEALKPAFKNIIFTAVVK